MTRDEMAHAVATLLRQQGAQLDDAMVERVRQILAAEKPPAPVEPEVLRGGPEPVGGELTVRGELYVVGDQPMTQREEV